MTDKTKKIIIVALLLLAIAAPSYAVNIVDKVLCKPVHLRSNNRNVLVNRVTGIVEYVLSNGRYMPLRGGVFKNKLQAIYNAQNANK